VSYLRRFGRFWWHFVVGDEWRIALIVAVATALGVVASLDGRIRGEIIACGVAVGVMAAVCDVVIAAGRRSR
jgi:hypothetical protein